MRVAAIQFKADRRDRAGSLRRLVELSREAAPDADLLVLPEMAATGYRFPTAEAARAVAEPARGPTFEALAGVARDAGAWLVCGFPERDRDRLFNSALVIDPAGELRFTYRKRLLYEADEAWASPGDSGYATFDTDAGDFTVGICMDLNDDDFIGWCLDRDPRAIAFPTNWIDEGFLVWPYWAWRLDGVRSALVAANTWGAEGDLRFSGRSAVLERREVLTAAPLEGDHILRATLPARRIPRGPRGS